MSDPKNPKVGDQSIDIHDIKLTDITPDQAKKLTKMREGARAAVLNVLEADPEARKRAGVSAEEIGELSEIWAAYQRIEAVQPAVDKLAELVRETRLVRGHEIATRLGEIANQIRRRGERAPSGGDLVAPFDALLEYQFGPAQKGAATREKAKTKTAPPAAEAG